MIRIELLTTRHDRRTFDCGEPSLDDWLARMALQQQAENYARTRVAVEDAEPARILGYYAMVGHELDATLAPGLRPRPPRLPCLLLARLAVDRSVQGQRLGERLLADAILRTRSAIEQAAGVGLVVDALHERAADFYRRYGFEPFRDDPCRLFLRVDWP